jgi:hypothetical protein
MAMVRMAKYSSSTLDAGWSRSKPLEVVGPALVRVGPPPHHGQVAVVRDAHAGRGQPLGQSGSAQRG